MFDKSVAKSLLAEAGIKLNLSLIDSSFKAEKTWQETLAIICKCLQMNEEGANSSIIQVQKDIPSLLKSFSLQDHNCFFEVVVTGSLLLVGAILEQFQWEEKAALGSLRLTSTK